MGNKVLTVSEHLHTAGALRLSLVAVAVASWVLVSRQFTALSCEADIKYRKWIVLNFFTFMFTIKTEKG
jgi:hypothetical protein